MTPTPRQLYDAASQAGLEMPGLGLLSPDVDPVIRTEHYASGEYKQLEASLADVESAVREGLAKLNIHIGPMTERYKMVGWYAAELGPGDHGGNEWYSCQFGGESHKSWAEAALVACEEIAKGKKQ